MFRIFVKINWVVGGWGGWRGWGGFGGVGMWGGRCDPNKYPQHMFLGVLNTVFLNISNDLPHLVLRNCSIPIVVITNFVVISNVDIKRFDSTTTIVFQKTEVFLQQILFLKLTWRQANFCNSCSLFHHLLQHSHTEAGPEITRKSEAHKVCKIPDYLWGYNERLLLSWSES